MSDENPKPQKKVAVVACPDYDPQGVRSALLRAVALIGAQDLVSPGGESVFIKPNIVMAGPPALAVTTHPTVVAQLTSLFAQGGREVLVGDCPGFYVDGPSLRRVYRQSGYIEPVEAVGGRMCEDASGVRVSFPRHSALRELPLSAAMMKAGMLINAAKLKTHSLMGMTAAVKNLFGVVPGVHKAEMHARFPRPSDLADVLIDLCEQAHAALHIVDAVVAMEGPGPTAGSPRRVGVLLAGTDPYAVDAAGARLMGMKPASLPLIRRSVERGFLAPDFSDVSLVGDEIAGFIADPPFKPAELSEHFLIRTLGRLVPPALKESLRVRPVVDPSACVGCGDCSRACPARAIDMTARRPAINYSECIRCFCCQELCPRRAVHLRRGAARAAR